MAEMTKAGVQFYVPTDDEIAAWAEACGHQRPEWDSWKKDLAGFIETFDRLPEAANTPTASYLPDVSAGPQIGSSGRGAAGAAVATAAQAHQAFRKTHACPFMPVASECGTLPAP